MIKSVIVIMGLLFLVSSVSAVVYPQEYYDLKNQSNDIFSVINISNNSVFHNTDAATYATVLELRRQNILLEKQNEIMSEIVAAKWIENCYVPSGMGGSMWDWKYATKLKEECAKAGYPVG